MENRETSQLMIQCDCYAEILVISESSSSNHQEFDIAIFEHNAFYRKPNLWQRLKYAVKHIWTGKIYTDYMCLNDIKAEQLAIFIKQAIEKRRPSKI